MKLVSVIIPIYKVEDYIAATVQSVLDQTYKHFELLIIDDGSPDHSREICQKFNDSRIKIIEQNNQGVSAARNRGIKEAKGEFIAFLDGDDLWLPEKLNKHVRHLENSPQVGVSFSRFSFIDETGQSLKIFKISKIEEITPTMILCYNPVGNPSCVVVRRNIFKSFKFSHQIDNPPILDIFFEPNMSGFEDVECWLRIALETNWKIEGIAEALTIYRVNPKGASSDFRKQLDGLTQMLEKTNFYAPELVTRYAKVIRAYMFRKGSQRAIRQREKSKAIEMIYQALFIYPQIIFEEPFRTFLILGAAYCLYLLPLPIYCKIEKLALKIIGFLQRLIWLN